MNECCVRLKLPAEGLFKIHGRQQMVLPWSSESTLFSLRSVLFPSALSELLSSSPHLRPNPFYIGKSVNHVPGTDPLCLAERTGLEPVQGIRSGPLCFSARGFSRHAHRGRRARPAGTVVPYVIRPPLATGKLQAIDDDTLAFTLDDCMGGSSDISTRCGRLHGIYDRFPSWDWPSTGA